MKKNRWLAGLLGIVLTLMLAAARLSSQTTPNLTRVPGTLEGLESCTHGELWLSRFQCDASGCDRGKPQTVFLRWSEHQLAVRTGTEEEEVAVPLELRAELLRDFGTLEWKDAQDPHLYPEMVRRDAFMAGGACDGDPLPRTEGVFRIDLGSSLPVTPIRHLHRAFAVSVRGPGPRAATLFNRMERLAR